MRSPRARAPDTLLLAPPPAHVPGSPGPRLPEQAGGLAHGPQTFPTTQGCPARTLVDSASGPGSRWPALCQCGLCTHVCLCAHPRALPEGCMTGQQGGLLRKSRTHMGERESRRIACVQTSQHVLLDETRAQGTQPHRPLTGPGGPHLSTDLDTTLFIPRTLTLSQHGPPGATHQGFSPDSWRHWPRCPRASRGVRPLLPTHTRPQELPQKGPLLLSPV